MKQTRLLEPRPKLTCKETTRRINHCVVKASHKICAGASGSATRAHLAATRSARLNATQRCYNLTSVGRGELRHCGRTLSTTTRQILIPSGSHKNYFWADLLHHPPLSTAPPRQGVIRSPTSAPNAIEIEHRGLARVSAAYPHLRHDAGRVLGKLILVAKRAIQTSNNCNSWTAVS
jgi:hypothetical protein